MPYLAIDSPCSRLRYVVQNSADLDLSMSYRDPPSHTTPKTSRRETPRSVLVSLFCLDSIPCLHDRYLRAKTASSLLETLIF